MSDAADGNSRFDALIEALVDVLDIRDIFDRVSQLAQPMLPHQILGVIEVSEDGMRLRLHATTGSDAVPSSFELDNPDPEMMSRSWDYVILDDLPRHPLYGSSPAVKAGMHSVLSVPLRFGGRLQAAVSFFRRDKAAFSPDEVPVAMRVARLVALAMSHYRLAAEAKRAAELELRAASLESRVRTLTDELDARTGYRRVIGESEEWRGVLRQVTQVAATETTVLLQGESGTGKEVLARLLHRGSDRRDGPFVALNCAALPEHLLEAELFGFERGAFTGAIQTKPGQIEQAAGGVLFLDEVAEMTLSAQAKFLRVLQEREFQRLGGNRVIRADVRIVAATNRVLRKAVDRGTFREDLYYRLNVFEIRLPPLRERRNDVLPLSEAFISEIGRSLGRPPSGISREARQTLLAYHWPGNVRELRNILERAAILADGGLIVSEHLGLIAKDVAAPEGQAALPDSPATAAAASPDLRAVERATIQKALIDARFNKSIAAKALGLSRAQLYTRLRRHGLE